MTQRIRRLSLVFVSATILMVVIVLLFMTYQQARAFAKQPRSFAEATPADYGIEPWREVSFTSEDGLTLYGWYVPPQTDKTQSAILFVHGHNSNRGQLLIEAAMMRDDGYGMLFFEMRNHGESDGDSTSMGYHELKDAQAAFAFLAAQPDVNPDFIAIYGHSMGAATSIRTMARIEQARALVVDAPYADFADLVGDALYIRTGLPSFPLADITIAMTGALANADMWAIRPIDDIASIAPRPILILHGTDDPLVPLEHARTLYDIAGEPKQLVIVEGGAHGNLDEVEPSIYPDVVLPFLRTYLKPDAPQNDVDDTTLENDEADT